MQLKDALRIRRGEVIALVGAGGKTSTLFRLADELVAAGWRVVTTTTTHLGADQRAQAPATLSITSPDWADTLAPALERHRQALVVGDLTPDGQRMGGPPLDALAALARHPSVDALIVEADGSRRLPLKAPAAHEPPIPDFATLVVIVAGLNGVGRPLTQDTVHRPQRFADLSGLALGDTITPAAVAQVVTHAEGGLRHAPATARVVALLNQADREDRLEAGREIAGLILKRQGIDEVIVATLQAAAPVIEIHGRVAGIVLAAGGSTRLGRPKPLLPWQGRTLIEHVVRQAQTIGLDDLIVVTGAAGDQVAQAVGDHARVVLNPKWMDGQSSSLQVGLRALRPHAAAALFILADQPDLRPEVARLLIARWQATRAPVVVPRYQGRRGNPAIFDRATFGDLLALRGDVGGRPVIEAYGEAVEWIDVPLAPPADIDTPEEYERMLLAM